MSLQGDSKAHIRRRPWTLPLAGALLGAVLVVGIVATQQNNPNLRPSDSHVVFIHSDGSTQTVSSKSSTVGELVSKLDLGVSDQDVIEPAPETPIVEDNFRINIYRARPVTVVDGNTKTVMLTAQKSARMVAEQAGLQIGAEDVARFTQGSVAENIIGEKVVVSRATPILLNLYGAQLQTYTQAKTVGGLLAEKNINLADGESVNPAKDTPISANMQVFVLRKGAQVEVIEEVIPIPIQVVSDPTLSLGASAVRQNGVAGKKAVTYLIVDSGSGPKKQLVHEVIISAAVPQIVARGSAINVASDKSAVMNAAGIAASDHGYVNYIISHENALWCPTRWQGQNHCPATYAEKFPGAESSTSVGYGLGQATPAIKMAPFGADWRVSAVTQLKWADSYATTRYGTWAAAYSHKRDTGWW